ncbi:MAG TPA: plasmid pRiA4b ORF-3 family protein [Polyangia bacterium]|jgi:hypothetical protein|nr:plasmid pRiA4b ORF-3 family protein [Polyangia bacterium]
MPKNGDFKKLVRDRMAKTGESYTSARMRMIRSGNSVESGPPLSPALSGKGVTEAMDAPAIYQLKITIVDIEPAIWRRVLVPAETTLDQLHKTIQAVFGWWDYHLHQYVVDDRHYGLPDPEYSDELPEMFDERNVALRDVFGADTIVYEYDFGDDWKHSVEIESVTMASDPNVQYPVCTGGARACPREDCGGTPGYFRVLEILGDPMHEEYREMKTWVGKKYDPEKFDLVAIDRALRKLRKRPSGIRRGRGTRA